MLHKEVLQNNLANAIKVMESKDQKEAIKLLHSIIQCTDLELLSKSFGLSPKIADLDRIKCVAIQMVTESGFNTPDVINGFDEAERITLISQACKQNSLKIVDLLLAYGADVTLGGLRMRKSALDYATGNPDIEEKILPLTQTYIDKWSDPEKKSDNEKAKYSLLLFSLANYFYRRKDLEKHGFFCNAALAQLKDLSIRRIAEQQSGKNKNAITALTSIAASLQWCAFHYYVQIGDFDKCSNYLINSLKDFYKRPEDRPFFEKAVIDSLAVLMNSQFSRAKVDKVQALINSIFVNVISIQTVTPSLLEGFAELLEKNCVDNSLNTFAYGLHVFIGTLLAGNQSLSTFPKELVSRIRIALAENYLMQAKYEVSTHGNYELAKKIMRITLENISHLPNDGDPNPFIKRIENIKNETEKLGKTLLPLGERFKELILSNENMALFKELNAGNINLINKLITLADRISILQFDIQSIGVTISLADLVSYYGNSLLKMMEPYKTKLDANAIITKIEERIVNLEKIAKICQFIGDFQGLEAFDTFIEKFLVFFINYKTNYVSKPMSAAHVNLFLRLAYLQVDIDAYKKKHHMPTSDGVIAVKAIINGPEAYQAKDFCLKFVEKAKICISLYEAKSITSLATRKLTLINLISEHFSHDLPKEALDDCLYAFISDNSAMGCSIVLALLGRFGEAYSFKVEHHVIAKAIDIVVSTMLSNTANMLSLRKDLEPYKPEIFKFISLYAKELLRKGDYVSYFKYKMCLIDLYKMNNENNLLVDQIATLTPHLNDIFKALFPYQGAPVSVLGKAIDDRTLILSLVKYMIKNRRYKDIDSLLYALLPIRNQMPDAKILIIDLASLLIPLQEKFNSEAAFEFCYIYMKEISMVDSPSDKLLEQMSSVEEHCNNFLSDIDKKPEDYEALRNINRMKLANYFIDKGEDEVALSLSIDCMHTLASEDIKPVMTKVTELLQRLAEKYHLTKRYQHADSYYSDLIRYLYHLNDDKGIIDALQKKLNVLESNIDGALSVGVTQGCNELCEQFINEVTEINDLMQKKSEQIDDLIAKCHKLLAELKEREAKKMIPRDKDSGSITFFEPAPSVKKRKNKKNKNKNEKEDDHKKEEVKVAPVVKPETEPSLPTFAGGVVGNRVTAPFIKAGTGNLYPVLMEDIKGFYSLQTYNLHLFNSLRSNTLAGAVCRKHGDNGLKYLGNGQWETKVNSPARLLGHTVAGPDHNNYILFDTFDPLGLHK